jgi:hypothetical protein
MPASDDTVPDDTVPSERSRLEKALIRSWEYRHLRFWAGLRIGGGIVLAVLGVITLGYGGGTAKAYLWSLIFLVPAAANLAFASWQISISHRLPTAPLPRRVRELEQSRAHVVDDSAARLRLIERDLHDGAQAQMVAVTMKLGLAVKKLGGLSNGTGPGPVDRVDLDRVDLDRVELDRADLDRVLELVVDAHRGAREAVAELRDLCRGIHPPVLDQGLEIALSTLAARCDLPGVAGHRPARAPVGRDRDHRLLLCRRTAHQRGQAQRRPPGHAGGGPAARPAAAGPGQRRRLRRRPRRGSRRPGRAGRADPDRGRQPAGQQPARRPYCDHRRAAVTRVSQPETR